MSSPPPDDGSLCAECGARLAAEAGSCWLCGTTLPPAASAAAEPVAASERRAAYQFSLASLMLTVTLVAVLLGLFRMAAGLGITLAILVAPAWLRTCIVAARRKARGQPVPIPSKLGIFASTMGIVFGIVVIIIAALVAAVSGYCGIAALGESQPGEWGPGPEDAPMFLLTALGALAAIAVVIAIFVACRRRFRAKRKTNDGARAEESHCQEPPRSSKG
jgi:hypothetical protein